MSCSEVAFLPTAGGHVVFRIFSSQCHNSLVFAARQMANNLSPVAQKFLLGLTHNIIRKKSNNLASALQFFLCLFCARFALLITGLSN